MTRDDIQAAYETHGYDQGWSFMMTPEASLRTATVAMVGLNPGGSAGNVGHWDHAPGNAYFMQKWSLDETSDSAIQRQVKAIHDVLDIGENEIFAAQFIPFRSRDFASLTTVAEDKAFAMRLWTWVVEQSPARLYLCMGKEVGSAIGQLIGASWKEDIATGWGRTKFRRRVSSDGRVVVEMPHPSRYQLFSRGPKHVAVATEALKRAARPVG